MNRAEIDESEHVAAQRSDLRSTNPWLAAYTGNAVRATRPSRPAVPNARLWAGAVGAVLLTIAITSGEHVEAEGTRASPGHYPLDRNGGIAATSPSLDRYLATLEERATARQFLLTFGDLLFRADSAQIGDGEKRELVRMADFLRAHPETVAQIVGHANDRGAALTNSRLAEQRATAVRSYLVVQGIDASRLTAASGAEGNRRVEILVQKSPTEPLP